MNKHFRLLAAGFALTLLTASAASAVGTPTPGPRMPPSQLPVLCKVSPYGRLYCRSGNSAVSPTSRPGSSLPNAPSR